MQAGTAGLNHVAAGHCFILDAPMNSAVEEQAIDRIHQISQTRPVIVKCFTMKKVSWSTPQNEHVLKMKMR